MKSWSCVILLGPLWLLAMVTKSERLIALFEHLERKWDADA